MDIMLVVGPFSDKLAEGTLKSVVYLANELVDRGHSVSIATREDKEGVRPAILDDRIEVYPVPIRPSGVLSVRRFVQEQDPDVVNVHSSSTNMALFWRLAAGRKAIITFPTFRKNRWKVYGRRIWHPQVHRRLKKTVATPSIQDHVPGKSIVTPYGVDTEKYSSQQPLDPSEPSLFYIGSPNRGLVPACNALSQLDNAFEFRVAVADRFGTKDTVEQLLTDHSIREKTDLCTEYIKDMPAYMNKSDILLNLLDDAAGRTCPPILTLEAMSCGRVPIVTDIPEFRTLIEDGTNGFLVDNTDYDDIADKIRWLREHPEDARAMGQRARNTILEQHSLSVSADAFEEAYRELVTSTK